VYRVEVTTTAGATFPVYRPSLPEAEAAFRELTDRGVAWSTLVAPSGAVLNHYDGVGYDAYLES
jgi:hypothetical protein